MDYGNSAVAQLGQAAREQPSLEVIANRIDAALDNARRLGAELCNVADRALGAGPTSAENGVRPQTVRSGAVGTIEDRLDQLFDVLGATETVVNRLSRLA